MWRIQKIVLAALALAATLAGCAALDTWQREWIFRPVAEDWRGYSPDIVAHEDVWIPVGDHGEKLHAWWVKAQREDAPVVLYLHGVRWNLTGSVYRVAGFRRMGYHVLAIDYRGFGKSSPGLPSEESVYEDAMAAWGWLAEREPDPRKRLLYGYSLGGAVATELATRIEGAGALVLESTFTSIREVVERTAARHLPLDTLLTQRFETLEKIRRVGMPVVIVHGDSDSVVPVDMARRLYDAAPGPKRLFIVEGAGHRGAVRAVSDKLPGALAELACAAPAPGVRTC